MLPVYAATFLMFSGNPGKGTFAVMQALYAIPYAAFAGAACTLALERFPVVVRATGGSTGYNVATAIFGGMAPFWLAFAENMSGSALAPLAYVALTMGLGIVAAIVIGRADGPRPDTAREWTKASA